MLPLAVSFVKKLLGQRLSQDLTEGGAKLHSLFTAKPSPASTAKRCTLHGTAFVSITPKDDNLISMALQGDQKALDVLFTPLLCDHRILRNREEAEDAVPGCLLLAYRNFLKGESSFRSWLARILINQALAILRKKKEQTRSSTVFDFLNSSVPDLKLR